MSRRNTNDTPNDTPIIPNPRVFSGVRKLVTRRKNGGIPRIIVAIPTKTRNGGIPTSSNPPSSTNFKRHLFLGWRFLLLFFNFYAPRRIFYCLSASRTNNEHHRPEVALDKSSKHEPGKALIAYKRGERRSLLLNPKSSELGLGLIYQGLSQRVGIRCGELSTRLLLLACFASDCHERRKNE